MTIVDEKRRLKMYGNKNIWNLHYLKNELQFLA